MNIIFASGGNDSIALFQFCVQAKMKELHVAYSDTGWSADWWPERIQKIKSYVESCGAIFHIIESEGMVNLIKRKKAWPANGMAFCSYELKIKPAMEWLESIDPEKEARCLVGVRREESARRRQWPLIVDESENHGGRQLYSPLVAHTEEQRNLLIKKAGFEVLPHRSMECYPCVNASKADIRMLPKERIDYIEAVEIDMGHTGKGSARTMFRPKNKMGATGIREVWQWSQVSNYDRDQPDMFCDSGYCGG
jgi:3'-phosphoadenosine 5'-phosphosulfate sulfotransferase (PAPS reductase)/FAD synthetase